MCELQTNTNISDIYRVDATERETKVLEEILQKGRFLPSDLHIKNTTNLEFISWLVHEKVDCKSNVFIVNLLGQMPNNTAEFYGRYKDWLILKDICAYYLALLQLKTKEYSTLNTDEKNYLAGKAFEEGNHAELAKYLDDGLYLYFNSRSKDLAVSPYQELKTLSDAQIGIFITEVETEKGHPLNVVRYIAYYKAKVSEEIRKTVFQHIDISKYAILQTTYKLAISGLFSKDETEKLCVLALNPDLADHAEYLIMCKNSQIGSTYESYVCYRFMNYYYKYIVKIYTSEFIKKLAKRDIKKVLYCLAYYLTEYNNRVSCEQIEELITDLKTNVKTNRPLRHEIRKWRTEKIISPIVILQKNILANLAEIRKLYKSVDDAIRKVECQISGRKILDIAKENTNKTIVRLITELIDTTAKPGNQINQINELKAELLDTKTRLSIATEKLKKYENP